MTLRPIRTVATRTIATRTTAPRTAATLLVAGLATAALSACSGSATQAGGAPPSGPTGETGSARVVNVEITAARGCLPDTTTVAAGGVTVHVKNKDATAVSEVEWLDGERIAAEKENLPPGFDGTFSVTVQAGKYTLYCPGATPERRTLTVTGSAAATGDATVAALLARASKGYATYVDAQVGELVKAVGTLNTALAGTDLAAAQRAYVQARPFYEKIEPVAESFVVGQDSIDADIDVRIADTTFAKWTGFHRIEYGLFEKGSLQGLSRFGARLVSDVARLQKLTTGLTYKPVELANGAQELLDEVAGSKITGEEEAYSRIDLLDVANNTEGAEQAFAQLTPALTRIDPDLAAEITTSFAALDRLVDTYRTTANASGYRLYPQLTTADKTSLAAAVKAVQEPLSRVASKVADA